LRKVNNFRVARRGGKKSLPLMLGDKEENRTYLDTKNKKNGKAKKKKPFGRPTPPIQARLSDGTQTGPNFRKQGEAGTLLKKLMGGGSGNSNDFRGKPGCTKKKPWGALGVVVLLFRGTGSADQSVTTGTWGMHDQGENTWAIGRGDNVGGQQDVPMNTKYLVQRGGQDEN